MAGAIAWILDTFALAERVVRENDVALAREVGEEFLIARPRLAVRRVAEGPEDCRPASRSGRYVEIRRHVQPRTALEYHLFNPVARPLDGARHPRVERSPIERPAEHLPQFRDDRFLPVNDLFAGGDRVDGALAAFARIVGEADQVTLEIAGVVGQRVSVQVHTGRARRTLWRGGLCANTS